MSVAAMILSITCTIIVYHAILLEKKIHTVYKHTGESPREELEDYQPCNVDIQPPERVKFPSLCMMHISYELT